jgi:hypothetical protein
VVVNWIQLTQVPVAGCCEQGSGASIPIKTADFPLVGGDGDVPSNCVTTRSVWNIGVPIERFCQGVGYLGRVWLFSLGHWVARKRKYDRRIDGLTSGKCVIYDKKKGGVLQIRKYWQTFRLYPHFRRNKKVEGTVWESLEEIWVYGGKWKQSENYW